MVERSMLSPKSPFVAKTQASLVSDKEREKNFETLRKRENGSVGRMAGEGVGGSIPEDGSGLGLDKDMISGLVSYCELADPQDAKEYLDVNPFSPT
ncbi:hypothetical protein Prudu_014950 [Prunus dulcis]|uniref:Uncharacterized protein n=1 Tax=Prunus dulcis TaxID=3755 RepID=A0A4Y1RIL6_PRUDU|nr:hypothetical protein Prudu_014950 [Prunus dulcis]